METSRLNNMNTATLAYMGDAVYEQAVRERIIGDGNVRVDRLHRKATGYVRAQAQAEIIRQLFDELDPREQSLVKRCRNHKYHSKAKHADPMTYKWATAFEALVGYLYLAGQDQRLQWLLERSFAIIEDPQQEEEGITAE